MSNIQLNIKYIPEIFPGVDFVLKRNIYNYSLVKTDILSTQIKTSDKWAVFYDNSKFERTIQTELYQRWKLQFQTFENTNIELLTATEHATIIKPDSRILSIFDVTIEVAEIQNTRLKDITVNFSEKIEDAITNPLSSDNVFKYYNSGNNVGVLTAVIPKTPYVYTTSLTYDTGVYKFSFPRENQFKNIKTNDIFYFHILDSRINVSNDVVKCTSVTTDIVNFETTYTSNTDYGTINGQIILNEESGSFGVVSLNIKPDLEVKLYTLLKPKIIIPEINYGDDIQNGDDIIILTDKVTTANILYCKFWLKNEELWKINYISISDSVNFFDGTNYYYASEIKQIINQVEKEITDLYEFDMKLVFNKMTVNTFR